MKFKKWLRSSLNLKHLITIIAAIICLMAAMFSFSDKIYSLSEYNSFLQTRNYNYSVIVDKKINEDCYAYFGKSLTFSKTEDMSDVINSLTIMDVGSEHTKHDFLYGYNLDDLGKNEVLISANISRYYDLSEGDSIYSRNEISTGMNRYIIKGIIDEIYGINEKDTNNEKGLIILGENRDYENNLKLEFIYFYYNDYSMISNQGAHIRGELYSLDDTKKVILFDYLFYICVVTLILMTIMIITISLLLNFNICNYQRKKIIGYLDVYSNMRSDIFAYFLLITFIPMIIYGLFSIVSVFSIELYINFILFSTIIMCISYLVVKDKVKRG